MKSDTTKNKPNQESSYPVTFILGNNSAISIPGIFPPVFVRPTIQERERKSHQDKTKTESDGQYMDIGELASYIKRSKGAIRNLVLRRGIPYRKVGGRLIFLRREIDEWIQMAFGKNLDEIKNDA